MVKVARSSAHFCEPFSIQQISDSSKLKEFAADNFEFAENGRKFYKQVGNTVGKGYTAFYSPGLLPPYSYIDSKILVTDGCMQACTYP